MSRGGGVFFERPEVILVSERSSSATLASARLDPTVNFALQER